MFGSVRVTFGQVVNDIRKSSESGLHNNKNITRCFEDMNSMLSWQEQYRSRHSNIKFIFSSHRVISSIFTLVVLFKIANMGYYYMATIVRAQRALIGC